MLTQKNIASKHLNSLAYMTGSQKWLNRLHAIINNNLSDPSLNNEQIAEALEISERHLFRKVKEITNLSPQRYVSRFRLKRARQYLLDGRFKTVKETSFSVGFRNTSYFIRQFEREFGVKPLQVLQDAGWR